LAVRDGSTYRSSSRHQCSMARSRLLSCARARRCARGQGEVAPKGWRDLARSGEGFDSPGSPAARTRRPARAIPGAPVRTRRRAPLAGARGMGRSAVGGRWFRHQGEVAEGTGPPGDGSAVRFLGFGPLVALPVVEGAEQPAVLLGGQAPVGPLDDVVTLTGTGRLVAVLVHTALVTHLEDPS
jgi:hypothetical protein